MSLPVILESYRSEVDAEIKAILSNRKSPLYDMMRYHLGWIDDRGNPCKNNSGKALRPALCLFSCEASGGDFHKALPAAAALELVHNFSLIHDDIQDDDRERRHRPTVWAIWGKPQAINAGTAMRILANSAITRLAGDGITPQKQLRISQMLDEISLSLIEGQYLDIDFEDRFDITVNDYLKMISGKTSALISGSMEIGAYLGTDNAQVIQQFGRIGSNLGLAFQIRDDILGIWGDEAETGKSSGNDIRRRKKSYPVIFALDNFADAQKKELISIYKNNPISDAAVNKVLVMFESVGANTSAQKKVESYCNAAWQDFKGLNVSLVAKQRMDEIINFLTGRNY